MNGVEERESPPILVVEDDRKTAQLIETYLLREGYRVARAFDGRQALALFGDLLPGLVVLDIMLPKLDGWDVCREIRKSSSVPILFLTARDDEADRVLGLGLGADDYVVKPFSPRELVARIKAILRRCHPQPGGAVQVLKCDGLTLDLEKRRVTRRGEPVSLTPFEYSLLKALMTAPGRVFLRDELLRELYPAGEFVIDRVIDVHIGKLRQKVEDDPTAPRLILTVRGTGYRFADMLE